MFRTSGTHRERVCDARVARFSTALACAAILFACGACSKRSASARVPRIPSAPRSQANVETGIASWYGDPYHGRRTASGEVYDMNQWTAAHRTLPFQTWVEVRNLVNGQTVRVRINDRGPFVEGRIIDLSRAAAEKIGMIGPGTARVRVVTIQAPTGATNAERRPRP